MNALLTLANEYFLSYNASWKGFKHLMLLRACRACFVSYVVSRLSLADGAILPVGINTRWGERERRKNSWKFKPISYQPISILLKLSMVIVQLFALVWNAVFRIDWLVYWIYQLTGLQYLIVVNLMRYPIPRSCRFGDLFVSFILCYFATLF